MGEVLYDACMTIRGLRYSCVCDAKGISDIELCEPCDLPHFRIYEYDN